MRMSIFLSFIYKTTNGNEHSLTVEKLGNENDIRAKYNCDPDIWAKEHVAKLNAKEAEEHKSIQISFSPKSLISKNHQYSYNIGYLFLQSLYYNLGLHKICKEIKLKHKFEYDLNDTLAKLIYGCILSPSSKTATHRLEKYEKTFKTVKIKNTVRKS